MSAVKIESQPKKANLLKNSSNRSNEELALLKERKKRIGDWTRVRRSERLRCPDEGSIYDCD